MLIHPSQGPADRWVEVVFDCIVGSTLELPGDVFPLVADFCMREEESGFLVGQPGGFGDAGVELVVPPG